MRQVYALVGDSNVRRHMSPQNCRDRPPMAEAQVKICGKIEALAEVLRAIRSDVTNLLYLFSGNIFRNRYSANVPTR